MCYAQLNYVFKVAVLHIGWHVTFQAKIRLMTRKSIARGKATDLVTVFDAILTSRQTREKLQCSYQNLMSNNFHKTPLLKKI